MRHRILAAAIVAATLVPASGLPAQLLGGITGTFQRAQMIANQIAGLANQVRQLSTMARQVSELEEQLDHMKRVARGQVDALTQPFSELAAGSVGLVGEELGWGSDFSGAGGGLVNAVRDMGSTSSFTELWRGARGAADRVGEAEILELFRSHPPEASSRAVADYRQAREAADRQSVLDYAMLDAAAALAATIENAQGSFDALTAGRHVFALWRTGTVQAASTIASLFTFATRSLGAMQPPSGAKS